MGKVILYIATSLDGYIATQDGGVDWLEPFNNLGEDYGYEAFMANVGAVIMGGKTYRQVLGFGEWAYKDYVSYIVTSQALAQHEGAQVHKVTGDFPALVQKIKAQSDEDVFFVGGAQLTKTFLELGLIDEFQIAMMPVMLGKGIPLFLELDAQPQVKLMAHKVHPSGVAQLTYRVG